MAYGARTQWLGAPTELQTSRHIMSHPSVAKKILDCLSDRCRWADPCGVLNPCGVGDRFCSELSKGHVTETSLLRCPGWECTSFRRRESLEHEKHDIFLTNPQGVHASPSKSFQDVYGSGFSCKVHM